MVYPEIAIIIVNWNGIELTKSCIESIKEDSYPNIDIVLVDNGSVNDEAEELKRCYPEIDVLRIDDNLGFTGGNNAGLRKAMSRGYDYYLLLNNDTEIQVGLFTTLVRFMQMNPEAGAVQPLIMYMHEREKVWNAGGEYNKWFGSTKSRLQGASIADQSITQTSVEWISGCAFMISKVALDKVGLLEESFFAYYEDVDWSFRIKKTGFQLYLEPSARVFHIAGASTKKEIKEGRVNPIVHYLNVRNQLFIILKYVHGSRLCIAYPRLLIKVVAMIFYFLVRGRFEKLRFTAKGLYDGHKLQ